MGYLVELAPPPVEPISLDDAKLHSVIDENMRDPVLARYLRAAREFVEHETRKRIVARLFRYALDCFPGVIALPVAPVRGVSRIAYYDEAGTLQTLAASKYTLDLYGLPIARIVPKFGEIWPTTELGRPGAVFVEFYAGFSVRFSAAESTDTFTAPGHFLANGDAVPIWSHTGALPAALAQQSTYYARDVSGDTFKLAATVGGAAIDIGTNGDAGVSMFLGAPPETLLRAILAIFDSYDRTPGAVADRALTAVPYSAEALLYAEALPQP